MITAMTLTSFIIPSNSLADRMSVNLTLLLTAVAFKFVVSQSLPHISYLTLLDKYVLTSFVMLFFVVVENVAASLLESNIAHLIDNVVRNMNKVASCGKKKLCGQK